MSNIEISISRDITLCYPLKVNGRLKEHVAYIFGVEE
jgi:hypothetical protein